MLLPPTTRPRRASRLLSFVLLLLAAATARTQDFHRERLEQGRQALAAQRYAEAATDLEIACFGMMDNPARRAGCKVYLFLAQRGAGDAVAATDTLRLVARLEERHAAFTGASLDAETREEFLLEANASGVDLSVWPRLQSAVAAASGVADEAGVSAASLTPSQLERAVRNDPSNTAMATQLLVSQYQRGKYANVQRSAEELLATDPANQTAICLLAVATATRNRSTCSRTLEAIETCEPNLQDRRYARTRLQCYVDLERWKDGRRYSDGLDESVRNRERRLIRLIERESGDQPSSAPVTAIATADGESPTPQSQEDEAARSQAPDSGASQAEIRDPLLVEIEALQRQRTEAVREGDIPAITRVLERASALARQRPGNGELQELAGQAAYLLRRWDQARLHLEAADAVHEMSAFSLFYLATAQEQTGSVDVARDTFRRALEAGLPPRAPQVTELEQRLQDGS